jgi:hypothetical protein
MFRSELVSKNRPSTEAVAVVPQRKSSLRRRIISFFAVFAITAGILMGGAAPSQAATAYCGSGSCTVYLNKTETRNLSQGRVPRLSLGALTGPYLTLAYGHIWIAKGWVSRGYCVGFRVDIRPWATQGMFGWRC